MPRTNRIKSATFTYHIIIRGINHSPIFQNDKDFLYFLSLLKYFSKENSILIYAYVLMDNHIHLLLKDPGGFLPRFIKQISVKYVFYFNSKYTRCGTLFQSRYKSENVEKDSYLLSVLRYIHQNPLKAGLVKKLEDYPWSSFTEYLKDGPIIHSEFIKNFFANNMKKFYSFNNEPGTASGIIEINKIKITDKKLIEILKKEFSISPIEFKFLSLEERGKILLRLKKETLSTKQLERLLEVNRIYLHRTLNSPK